MARGYHLYGLRDARKLVRETRKRMGRDQQPYARGWKAGLKQVEQLIDIHIADIEQKMKIGDESRTGESP
jgi:hypothetical protein